MSIELKQARYLTAAASYTQCPADVGGELAVIGRSNAGKSSAINALLGRPLARTSRTPGRTQLMHFFSLGADAGHRLVDLPGYGYAKAPDTVKARWAKMTNEYLQRRQSLKRLICVVDARHLLKPLDYELIDWAIEAQLPLALLLTKIDKLSRQQLAQQQRQLTQLTSSFPASTALCWFSAKTLTGLPALRAQLVSWLGG